MVKIDSNYPAHSSFRTKNPLPTSAFDIGGFGKEEALPYDASFNRPVFQEKLNKISPPETLRKGNTYHFKPSANDLKNGNLISALVSPDGKKQITERVPKEGFKVDGADYDGWKQHFYVGTDDPNTVSGSVNVRMETHENQPAVQKQRDPLPTSAFDIGGFGKEEALPYDASFNRPVFQEKLNKISPPETLRKGNTYHFKPRANDLKNGNLISALVSPDGKRQSTERVPEEGFKLNGAEYDGWKLHFYVGTEDPNTVSGSANVSMETYQAPPEGRQTQFQEFSDTATHQAPYYDSPPKDGSTTLKDLAPPRTIIR